MKAIIDVFRMTEVSAETRIRIIEKLGKAINDSYSMSITNDLVDELVKLLKEQEDN